jgi:hypothetical protein
MRLLSTALGFPAIFDEQFSNRNRMSRYNSSRRTTCQNRLSALEIYPKAEEKCTSFWWKSAKERDHSEHQGV